MAVDNSARLIAAGPIDPVNGFPLWFEDTLGIRLELGLRSDPLTPAIGELPNPAAPMHFPDNFPDETFYFMAEARLPVGGAGVIGRARVIMALEAAFGAAGEPKPGLNVVFSRMRVRIDDVVPGASYVVTHPYGETDPLIADDRGRVFHTEDLGIVEGDATAVLRSGRIAPFLRWAAAAPAGYVGDGASERQIAGSPFGTNFVRITGPGIRAGGGRADPAAPADMNRIWTDLFTVQGRIAHQLGATATGATYAKVGGQTQLRVHAKSVAGQSLEFVGDGVRIAMAGAGAHYAGLAVAAAVPASAEVVNATDVPPTHWPVIFTDQVVVESAIHDLAAGTLDVRARSSDPSAVLTIPAMGLTISAFPQSFVGIAATPATLEIMSSRGGRGRQAVEIRGAAMANLGVVADALSPIAGVTGEPVTLDGSGSRAATGFSWAQTGGPSVLLVGGTTPRPRFTPPSPGVYAFNLTVQGPGGPKSDGTIVNVAPPSGPDVLAISLAQFRTGTREYRLAGTVLPIPNEVIATIGAFEIGRATPDATGAWAIRYTLIGAETIHAPAPGASIKIASRRATQTPVVQIRN